MGLSYHFLTLPASLLLNYLIDKILTISWFLFKLFRMTIRAIFYGHTFSWTAVNRVRPHIDNPLIRLDQWDQLKLIWNDGNLTTAVKFDAEATYEVGIHKNNHWHGKKVTGAPELDLEDLALFARLANFSFLPVAFFAGASLKAELKEAPLIGFALSVISCMGLHYGLQQRAWRVAQTVLRIHESADKDKRPDQFLAYIDGDNYNPENYQIDLWSRLVGYGLAEQQIHSLHSQD